MHALAPGDGEGRNGVWLAARGLEVDTPHLSTLGVAKARQLADERGVSIDAIEADALQWDWPEARSDVVALVFLHLVEADRRALHPGASRALKPGGLVVLEAFRPSRSAPDGRRARRPARCGAALSARGLAGGLLRRGHPLLEAAEAPIGRRGPLHVGDSAVVRALVRRR